MKFSALLVATIGLVAHTAALPSPKVKHELARSVQTFNANNQVSKEDAGKLKLDYRRSNAEEDIGEIKADYRRDESLEATEEEPGKMKADYRRSADQVNEEDPGDMQADY